MTLQFGLFVPQGWHMELGGIADPAEAYETMTRAAQVAEEVGYDSIWLFDHFHTTVALCKLNHNDLQPPKKKASGTSL
jgi:alkanesulfonate monooxygenase SsuD/methylene tetrahydromethanopterin reductase-like flavin-dependent oxidoreductase (luciferase family)